MDLSLNRVLAALFSIGAYCYALYILTGWLLFQMNCRDQIEWNDTLRSVWPFAIDFDPRDVSSTGGIDIGNLFRNSIVLLLWCSHHSTFARQFIKRYLPIYTERSIFVFVQCMLLHNVLLQWSGHHIHRDGEVLFRLVEPGTAGYNAFCSALLVSWLSTVAASFIFDHFQLFGMKQAVLNILPTDSKQVINPNGWLVYSLVRHPMMTGLLGVLVLSPICVMSIDRVMFSAINIIYISIGVYLEEQDLNNLFGRDYAVYSANVPNKFVPSGCPLFGARKVQKKQD